MSKQDRHHVDHRFTVAIVLFSVTLALLLLLQSSLFSLETIETVGTVYIQPEELHELGGIVIGDSLFDIDLRRVTDKLAAHPQVARVSVGRRLPSTLRLEIEERRPVALIPAEDGFALLDSEGRVLRLVDELRLPLPLLAAGQAVVGATGTLLQNDEIAAGLHVASVLPPDLAGDVAEIHVDNHGVNLHTRGAVVVQLGQATQLEEKFHRLQAVRRSLANEGETVRHIDLRVPKSPVLR